MSRLIVKPSSPQPEERADDRHRHGEQRDERRAPVLQEDEDDERDERHRISSVFTTSWIDVVTNGVVSKPIS